MEFEWDDSKRAANLEKHGIDFVRAVTIWQRAVIDPAAERTIGEEQRILALGTIGDDDIIVAVIYTIRNGIRRIISARRGRRNERTYYQTQFGRGT